MTERPVSRILLSSTSRPATASLLAAAFLFVGLVLAGAALPASAFPDTPPPAAALPAAAAVTVKTVDFLAPMGLQVNAAGPVLVLADPPRGRILAANANSSSFTVVDGRTRAVTNIPLAGRALQHLKSEALTVRLKTGEAYLVGDHCLHVIDPDRGAARSIPTEAQFESVAVDEETGSAVLAGRESKDLGFFDAATSRIALWPWLERAEKLANLNMTPPPPIRKVVVDGGRREVLAVDGYSATLQRFDLRTGKPLGSRPLPLTAGGRWHLAGYDEATHSLYLVTETDQRKVMEAARIDVLGGPDLVAPLPGFSEGVGIRFHPGRDEIYIAYDNHPSVHVVDFKNGGAVSEIPLPAYGNDAAVLDTENDLLYVGSWAHGEVDVLDLKERSFVKRITGLGIIPHMFSMTRDPNTGLLWFPRGATAVNGTFGAALCALDPGTEKLEKVRTGWAPIDLVELPGTGSCLIFDCEDRFAEVRPDGSIQAHDLPYDYPIRAIPAPGGDVYLSYGPHQSYWPVVYIWDAKNGVLSIDSEDFGLYDRRIPRQALEMALDRDGVLWCTQNNWGEEEQFLGTLRDRVRVFSADERLALGDRVERETTQRILEYDPELHRLYLARVAERDDEPSSLQVIDLAARQVLRRIPLGRTVIDLLLAGESLYAANFDSRSVTVIDRRTLDTRSVAAGEQPLRLARGGGRIWALQHAGRSLQEIGGEGKAFPIPGGGLPDNLFEWRDGAVVTSHDPSALYIHYFDPASGSFTLLHRDAYPFGDTRLDSGNASFYMRGQFGDALPAITRGVTDAAGRLWVTDFLSGRLFIIEEGGAAGGGGALR